MQKRLIPRTGNFKAIHMNPAEPVVKNGVIWLSWLSFDTGLSIPLTMPKLRTIYVWCLLRNERLISQLRKERDGVPDDRYQFRND